MPSDQGEQIRKISRCSTSSNDCGKAQKLRRAPTTTGIRQAFGCFLCFRTRRPYLLRLLGPMVHPCHTRSGDVSTGWAADSYSAWPSALFCYRAIDRVVSPRSLRSRPCSAALGLSRSRKASTELLVFHRDSRTTASCRRVVPAFRKHGSLIVSTAPTLIGPLLQRFFAEHLIQHKHVSPQTVASYRDTFRLLLQYTHRVTTHAPSRADRRSGA